MVGRVNLHFVFRRDSPPASEPPATEPPASALPASRFARWRGFKLNQMSRTRLGQVMGLVQDLSGRLALISTLLYIVLVLFVSPYRRSIEDPIKELERRDRVPLY